jgi:hypothetical protein
MVSTVRFLPDKCEFCRNDTGAYGCSLTHMIRPTNNGHLGLIQFSLEAPQLMLWYTTRNENNFSAISPVAVERICLQWLIASCNEQPWGQRCSNKATEEQRNNISSSYKFMKIRSGFFHLRQRQRIFFPLASVPRGPPSLLSSGYWGPFPGVKGGQPVTQTTHPPSSAEVNNEELHSPPWRLHDGSGTALVYDKQWEFHSPIFSPTALAWIHSRYDIARRLWHAGSCASENRAYGCAIAWQCKMLEAIILLQTPCPKEDWTEDGWDNDDIMVWTSFKRLLWTRTFTAGSS